MKNQTKIEMTAAAVTLAARHGYRHVTREQIAAAVGKAPSAVSYHLGTMEATRRCIVREAIRTENLPVLGQAIAAKDPHARKVSPELRTKAIDALRG